MTNIKITAFTDIGNNIAPTTLVPVVDMAGPSTTKKANLQNVGNLILNGAGGSNFVPAARAILSQSVTNAAQPNITSTGTLTSLTVSGNVNLGSVNNLTITGGTSGQVLSTDGNGVLSWVNDANSSYGDGNVVTLLSAFGSNTITTTGLVTGDGGGLSNVPYANVTGTPTLGNVSAINLDGNVANVLRGDGTFAATSGSYDDSNVAAYLPNYGGNVLVDSVVGNTTDNLGYMRWVGNSSGDGNGYTTIEVVPDDTLVANDQYLIIDPTVPSHIHIRAGGNIDNSQTELYLGGEKNYVRVVDGSGVRLQNQTRNDLVYNYSDPGTFTDGSWYESGGTFFVQYTTTDAELIDVTFEFNNDNDNTLEVTYNAGANTALLTSAGSISSLGGGVYRVSVNEEPPASPTVITALEYTIWNTRTNFARLQSNDFTVSVEDDVRITGNDLFSLRNRSTTDPITIRTDYDGADYVWEFSAEGILTVPNEGVIRSNDDTVILQSYDTANAVGKGIRIGTNGSLYFEDGSDTWLSIDNVSNNPVLTAPANSYVRIASNNGTHNWYFESDGNLTLSGNTVAINFANGSAAFGNIASINLDGSASNVLYGNGVFASVPSIGALTANLDANSFSIVNVGAINFDTSANISVGAGQLAWNDSDGTLDLGLKYGNVVLQVGEETLYSVRNETGSNVSIGTAVYCSGITSSGRISISPMIGNGSVSPVQFLGLATANIVNGVNGIVTWFGYIRGLDTRGTANTAISVGDENWAVGDKLYIHPTANGKLTNVEPQAPNVKICAATVVIRNQTSGVLFVRPTTNLTAALLSDVQITTPSNGEVLQYVTANSRWENIALTNVANANYANFAGNAVFATDAGNANVANIALSVDVANVSNIGNIASINLDGNVSNVLRGDGTFAADATGSYGDSNVASLLGAFGSNSISTTGNISATRLQNDANLEIRSNVAGAAKIWTFDSLGDINLPVGGNISGSGYVTALRIITDPVPLANLTAVAGGRAFVSDGNLVATGNFGAQIGSGGSNTVPVWSDGTNWYIG